MPEMLEVELYRRSASPLVGHRITEIDAVDGYWCRRAEGVAEQIEGRRIVDVRRVGKILLIETDGPTLALRFGMTGRLVVAGRSSVPDLVYGAHGDDQRWVRFAMTAVRSRSVTRCHVSDPRRLGGVEIDPDLSDLGPDAWDLDPIVLGERLGTRSAPVKAALLDQTVIAGLGNMLADEVLLRAGISPRRPARALRAHEIQALAAAIAEALPQMLVSGGSHSGHLSAALRRPGAPCPLDGAPLSRTRLGGRSSYWCPAHQS